MRWRTEHNPRSVEQTWNTLGFEHLSTYWNLGNERHMGLAFPAADNAAG